MEPAGTCRLGRCPFNCRYPMRQVVGDPEEDAVAGARVGDFAQDVLRMTFAQLKDATVIAPLAEIDAQTDQAMAHRIAMPGIVMAGTGHHAIDPANEATDAIAAGELLHEPEEPLVVGEKMQEIERHVMSQAQLEADLLVRPLIEFSLLDSTSNEAHESRLE